MERIEELLNSISEASNVSMTDIYKMVVLNDFSGISLEDNKENIAAIIKVTEDSLDNYRGKLIETAGANVDFNREANVKILKQNIKSLEEFMDQAVYAEEKINFAITGKATKISRGKMLGVPEDEQEFFS